MSPVARSPDQRTPTDAETTLGAFIAKFDPAHQRLIRDLRAALRRRFPAAHELVYDNYNFFVIGYWPRCVRRTPCSRSRRRRRASACA